MQQQKEEKMKNKMQKWFKRRTKLAYDRKDRLSGQVVNEQEKLIILMKKKKTHETIDEIEHRRWRCFSLQYFIFFFVTLEFG